MEAAGEAFPSVKFGGEPALRKNAGFCGDVPESSAKVGCRGMLASALPSVKI